MSKLSHLIKSELSYSKRYGYCYSKPEFKNKLKINALDTETDKGKPFLLGYYCWNGFKGYETPKNLNDILDIMTQRKYEDCINVFYNLTYDAEGMLKFIPHSELLKIYFKHNIIIKKSDSGKLLFLDLSDFDSMRKTIENDMSYYRVSYIPKKFLRIKQGHKSYNYYDLFQYYNTSLEKASTKYLGQHKGDVDREHISLDRFNRDKKYHSELIKYCIRDSELTQKLGDLLFQNIYEVYNSKKFISSASIAEDYILHNVKLNLPRLSDEIVKAWLSSYHGGRFEIMKRGKMKEVHEYDLSSAYASEMADMRMLSKEAQCIKVFNEDFTCEYGCYNIDIDIPKDIYIAPLPYYSEKKNQLEFPVGKFKDYWIDKVELEYLAKLGFDYKIHYGYEIFDPDARRDLRDIMLYAYKKKEYYKKLGDDIKANTYKTICNACFSNDTDILTFDGIKNIKNVKVGDIVYSLNPKTLKTELKPVTRLFKYSYRKKMIKIKSNRIDFVITPNHKLFVSPYDLKKYRFVEAKNLDGYCRWNLPISTPITGKQQKKIKIGKYKYDTDDFLELLGWIISEGCFNRYISHGKRNMPHYRIIIAQSKKDNIVRISNLLNKLQIGFYFKNNRFSISNKSIFGYLQKNVHNGSFNKRIPKNLFKLDSSHLLHLFISMMLGDGCSVKQQMMKYTTVSEGLAQDFLRLCLHLGYQTKLKKEFFKYNPNTKSFKNCGYVYRIFIYEKERHAYIHPKFTSSIKNKNGWVYCIEIKDNHTVYAGRNKQFNPISNSYGKCIQTIQEKTFEEINDPELINTLSKNEIFFVNDKMYMGVGGNSFRVGNMFSPYYASWITAKIRVKLLKTLDDFYDTGVHAFHTDSIISSKKLKTGNGIGEWELKKTGDLELYKCGYYKLGDKTRCRGYTYFNPQKSNQKRRIGLGYSIRNNLTGDLNVIVNKDIAFNLSDRKRIWFKVSKNLEDSKPIAIE